jgi:hypothetical protein
MLGFSPSHANRWMPCGGSVALSQPYLAQPQEDSDERLEGIAAHWVASEMFHGVVLAVGQQCPNGVVIDEEMLECAREYVATLPRDARLESKVDLFMLEGGMTSYPDASALSGRVLHVWDYKYGHSYVDVFENWQLLVETAGFDLSFVDEIWYHVVQPRCFQHETHRVWTVSKDEYIDVYYPQIVAQVSSIAAGGTPCVTGPQCKRCPAARGCSALAAVAYEVLDITREAAAHDLTSEQLARELDLLHRADQRLKARITGLEEQATATLRSGGRVPGYTMKDQAGRLDWVVPAENVFALSALYGVDVKKEPSAITPTQAIKLGLPKEAVETVAKRPAKAPKLERVDHNQIRKAFKK